MNKENLTASINKLVEGYFSVHSIDNINHNPHPYMIGTKHISHASKNYSGVLDERTMEKISCAHPRCRMRYKDHIYDTVVALKLIKNLTNDEALEILNAVIPLTEKEGIDGFIFIETKENFRIT